MRRNKNKDTLRVTPGQVQLLQVARRELQLDDEDYRAVLSCYGGVDSTKNLTMAGLERILKYFKSLGFTVKTKEAPSRAPDRNPDGLPYPAQLELIEKLFLQLGIFEPQSQRQFCKRNIKTHWPQSRAQANKIIEGLKAMLARKKNIG